MVRQHQRQEGKKLTEVARYLFHGEPDDLSKQAEELLIELPEDKKTCPDIEVEPECVAAVQMFQRVSGQWRTGPNAPMGLDLNVVLSIAKLLEMDRAEQLEMIDDLAIMEGVWLQEWGAS